MGRNKKTTTVKVTEKKPRGRKPKTVEEEKKDLVFDAIMSPITEDEIQSMETVTEKTVEDIDEKKEDVIEDTDNTVEEVIEEQVLELPGTEYVEGDENTDNAEGNGEVSAETENEEKSTEENTEKEIFNSSETEETPHSEETVEKPTEDTPKKEAVQKIQSKRKTMREVYGYEWMGQCFDC